METFLDQRILIYNRSTYGLLDWVSDIGGMVDALLLLLKMIIAPITTFNLKSYLLTIMFRLVPSQKSLDKENH